MKNSTIKSLFALGTLLAFAAPTFAQTPPPSAPAPAPEKQHKPRKDPFADLNLTAEQKEKIKTIQDAAKDKVKTIRTDATLKPEEKQEKIKVIRADERKDVLAVLTPEQLEKYKAAHKKKKKDA